MPLDERTGAGFGVARLGPAGCAVLLGLLLSPTRAAADESAAKWLELQVRVGPAIDLGAGRELTKPGVIAGGGARVRPVRAVATGVFYDYLRVGWRWETITGAVLDEPPSSRSTTSGLAGSSFPFGTSFLSLSCVRKWGGRRSMLGTLATP